MEAIKAGSTAPQSPRPRISTCDSCSVLYFSFTGLKGGLCYDCTPTHRPPGAGALCVDASSSEAECRSCGQEFSPRDPYASQCGSECPECYDRLIWN